MTGGDRYVVAKVAPDRLRLLRSGILDLRSLLVESDPQERYVATAEAGIDQPLALEKLTEPLEDGALLPDPGFLLRGRPLAIGRQIDELKLLEEGWLDGEGRAPSPEGLSWLLDVFDRRYPADAPLPYLYPTVTGGVQAEWPLGSREASLEVDVDSHSAEWHVLDLQSNEAQERTLNCDSDEDWKWLIGQISAE